jgi:aspartate/methionine/tyrosine aminotransferase
MQIAPFKLERFFAQYEFAVQYLLSASDCEPLTVEELLSYAGVTHRSLWDSLWLGYTESKGHPLLLEAIAELYNGIESAHVIEVVPEEGIFIAMNTLLRAGDHIVVSYPAYQSLYQVAHSIGCTLSHWMPDRANWQFDVTQLADLIQENTKLIIINFPHNPTGATLTQEQFRQIMDLAQQNHCIVFSDEMYRWSEYDARDRLPSACEVTDQAVALCGLSKTFALPGLRMGWLVTQNEAFMQRFTVFKDYTTICGSAPGEILAIIALAAKDKLIERTLHILNDNLSVLEDFFSRHQDILAWQRPKAGTITWVELLQELPIDRFAAELVRNKGVMIAPASQFEMDGNYFRLGFGRRNMPEALAHFEAFLQQTIG